MRLINNMRLIVGALNNQSLQYIYNVGLRKPSKRVELDWQYLSEKVTRHF